MFLILLLMLASFSAGYATAVEKFNAEQKVISRVFETRFSLKRSLGHAANSRIKRVCVDDVTNELRRQNNQQCHLLALQHEHIAKLRGTKTAYLIEDNGEFVMIH